MNTKLVIPAILAAVIVIGVSFAVMPVQRATTVHSTINTEINDLCKALALRVEDFNQGIATAANQTAAKATEMCAGVGI